MPGRRWARRTWSREGRLADLEDGLTGSLDLAWLLREATSAATVLLQTEPGALATADRALATAAAVEGSSCCVLCCCGSATVLATVLAAVLLSAVGMQ